MWHAATSLVLVLAILPLVAHGMDQGVTSMLDAQEFIKLPEIRTDSGVSLEAALRKRRSVRALATTPLDLKELGQLLWSAQGITDPRGLRTAPSAGALYPLELYVAVGEVAELDDGVYHYFPDQHALTRTRDGDQRAALAAAALGQRWVSESAVVLVFTAIAGRTTGKYGQRGVRYIHMEVGHAAQNVFLQATALGLGAAVVGAFDDRRVGKILALPGAEEALYLMPVGRPE